MAGYVYSRERKKKGGDFLKTGRHLLAPGGLALGKPPGVLRFQTDKLRPRVKCTTNVLAWLCLTSRILARGGRGVEEGGDEGPCPYRLRARDL